eukprot:TRINITY_DN8554_c0_g1_i1.p1 TRINITY_DN8554_c0_g1~~TRINITY_DN8554_c0_g1_i1.p1  ORF type:complete len:650 (-),score=233.10 TRINITY_DN8554_c0_g1_i1:250-2199(-)
MHPTKAEEVAHGKTRHLLKPRRRDQQEPLATKKKSTTDDELSFDDYEEEPTTTTRSKRKDREDKPRETRRSRRDDVMEEEESTPVTTPITTPVTPNSTSLPISRTPVPEITPKIPASTSQMPAPRTGRNGPLTMNLPPPKPAVYRRAARLPREAPAAQTRLINISQSFPTMPPTDVDKVVQVEITTPSPLLSLPERATWFNMAEISPVEERALPEFFDGKFASKSPQIYKEYRDFMINTYQQNPAQYLTQTACRRNLAGDVCAILRVHSFLEHWGLINFNLNPEIQATLPMKRHLPADSTAPVAKQLIRFEEIPQKGADFKTRKNIFFDSAIEKRTCTSCGKDCTTDRYHREDIELCSDCFAAGKFPEDTQASEYLKLSVPKDPTKNIWTDEETLLLLEALERYGEDWDAVADHVHTKSREDCIVQFLRLPIEDPYLEDGFTYNYPMKRNQVKPPRENFPFSTAENPIMSMVTFLASVVSPTVAAVAAQSALDAMMKLKKAKDDPSDAMAVDSESHQDGNEMENGKEEVSQDISQILPRVPNTSEISRESIKAAAAAALAAASLKAQILAEKEERDIKVLMTKVVELEMKKIELKLKTVDEMSVQLEKEKSNIERARVQIQEQTLKLQGKTTAPKVNGSKPEGFQLEGS